MKRDEVRRDVRKALEKELEAQAGADSSHTIDGNHRILTEKDVQERIASGATLSFPPGTRFTSLALETLERHLERRPRQNPTSEAPRDAAPVGQGPRSRNSHGRGPRETIAVGADHGGMELKEKIAEHLRNRGFVVQDCGTYTTEACDYPIFARQVAEEVRENRACVGVVVDGAGIGSAMTANKVRGIRAAHCHNTVEARNAREHNHAQILTMGAGIVGPTLALAIVDAFLATPFGGGRHARRVALIESTGERVSE